MWSTNLIPPAYKYPPSRPQPSFTPLLTSLPSAATSLLSAVPEFHRNIAGVASPPRRVHTVLNISEPPRGKLIAGDSDHRERHHDVFNDSASDLGTNHAHSDLLRLSTLRSSQAGSFKGFRQGGRDCSPRKPPGGSNRAPVEEVTKSAASETVRGKWPCTTTELELKNLEAEGFLQPEAGGVWAPTPQHISNSVLAIATTSPSAKAISGSGSQPPKAPRVPKKRARPSPASIPITPEVEVPPKASSASKPDPKDVIDLDDLPEDPAHHGDSAKGTSSPVPPQDQPSSAFAGPTGEEQEQKVKLLQVTNATRVNLQPTPSLQKLTLAQRHAEVSAMLNKVWGKPDEEMRELTDLEDSLKEFFAKHKEVRQTTRRLHEDLRVHVLEQIAEIEGLRQHVENSKKDIQLLETRLQEETAKHSSFDELSAKVKVLEAENESLKAFIQESSSKETEARKELSEKHARDLAELNEKGEARAA
ncbi:hypothetical protein QYE76_036052 [Lolium multiflorum]|uniref:Uncharacterized protein n=1 Tax=Lolium multiflorum TaxID=4521 RepID=A0AAD8VMR2_LOLMU|nr:hypothetical protein QYE76_036052 [Lolium multiflorum]